MTHYLRTRDGTTLVEVETSGEDLSVVVCIGSYSQTLLERLDDPNFNIEEFIEDFSELQELRGEWFERQEPPWVGVRSPSTPNDLVKERLGALATKYGFSYVTD